MIELNPLNRPKRLLRIAGWMVLSLAFTAAMVTVKQEFRAGLRAAEIAATHGGEREKANLTLRPVILLHSAD